LAEIHAEDQIRWTSDDRALGVVHDDPEATARHIPADIRCRAVDRIRAFVKGRSAGGSARYGGTRAIVHRRCNRWGVGNIAPTAMARIGVDRQTGGTC
jgi:hypothetical protein